MICIYWFSYGSASYKNDINMWIVRVCSMWLDKSTLTCIWSLLYAPMTYTYHFHMIRRRLKHISWKCHQWAKMLRECVPCGMGNLHWLSEMSATQRSLLSIWSGECWIVFLGKCCQRVSYESVFQVVWDWLGHYDNACFKHGFLHRGRSSRLPRDVPHTHTHTYYIVVVHAPGNNKPLYMTFVSVMLCSNVWKTLKWCGNQCDIISLELK